MLIYYSSEEKIQIPILYRDHSSHDRMVVGFTTTYAISTYHHWCCEFESQSGWGVQHYL